MDVYGKVPSYGSSTFWDKWYAVQGDQALEWSGQVNQEVLSRFKTVLDELPAPEAGKTLSICELGCGSSALAVLLKDLGFEVVGVDFSQEVINANKQRHPGITWECADALKLSDKFAAGAFDAIIGKTLLDCFMARRDAAGSIRQLCVQCHRVLKSHGRIVFLDRRSAYHIIGRGRIEELYLNKGAPPFAMHILKVLPSGATVAAEDDGGRQPSQQKQWELQLPALRDHLVTRMASGSGVLVVWTVDDVAAATGLKSGDKLVGFDCGDGQGMQEGQPREMMRALKKGAVKVLIERSAAIEEVNEGNMIASLSKPSAKTQAASRRSSSQTDHLRRLQRARTLGNSSSSSALPLLKVKPGLHISEHIYAAEQLFN